LTGRLDAEEARRLEPPPDVIGADAGEVAKSILAFSRGRIKK
jgi:hypothetical protein